MKVLDTVTIALLDGSANVNPNLCAKAINISSLGIKFARKILLTIKRPDGLSDDIDFFEIDNMDLNGYSNFIISNLNNYIDTEHVLIIQTDGFVINPSLWDDSFLEYDYIGACWDINTHIKPRGDIVCEKVRKQENPNLVGNGGFSLRSKRFCEVSSTCPYKCIEPEDVYVCLNHEDWFVDKHKMKYAPTTVARKFSQDPLINRNSTFGFHGNKGIIYQWKI